MNNSDFYYNLTPDKIINALIQGGFNPTGHCFTLNSFENRVYDLKLKDDSHVVIKFYRPGRWSEEQILEEHRFLQQLVDNEIPACAPLTLKNNSTVDKMENIYFSVWKRTGGRAPDELNDEKLEILGRFMGRLHSTGLMEDAKNRIRLDSENFCHRPLKFLLDNNFIPLQLEKKYADAAEKIGQYYDEIVQSQNIPFQRIHGDCHLGNILMNGNNFFILDFDDFLTGPAVQDMWMIAPAQDQEGIRQRNIFINSYKQFATFKHGWLKLIEPLKSLRFIHYAAWIARRWEDPAFPLAFPYFGTEKYWEDETRDLESQIKKIESESTGTDNSVNLYLDDGDYFWDM